MIIWISSYPKSGNTWVRSLLSAYMYSEDGSFDFKLLDKIKQFPDRRYLDFFLKEYKNIKQVSEYWIAAQDRINLFNKGITFLKTHSALCTLENNAFTNKINTKAAIYIVRDPRNVVTSISHHYSLNIKESFDFLKDTSRMLIKNEYGKADYGIATVLGSWSDHYKSWINLKFAPLKIIKYEDLIFDTKNTLFSLLNFLSDFMEINIDQKKIDNCVKSCKFTTLAQKEKEEGFSEAPVSRKNNKKLSFFHLGEKNNWRNLLDTEMEQKIGKAFDKEMKELGYR